MNRRILIPLALATALVGFAGYRLWTGGRSALPRGQPEHLAAGGLIISRTGDHQSMSPANKPTTQRAPDFRLQDYNSKTVRLADFAGKPVVVNSWAAWCPFCRQELVDFATVKREFGDRIEIIAIDRAESLETAKRYTDELGVTGDLVFLLDPGDSFYQSIGGFSMPETIFVDAAGQIVFHKRGPMEADEVRRRIRDAFGIE
ncbi:MAG: TlpA disulfide reductase family protein [Patescibacteria group bacterium]